MGYLTLGYLTLNAPPAETIGAAIAGGFKSVGIRITGRRLSDPYTHVIGNPPMIKEIKHRAADGGIRLANISAYHLFPDVQLSHLQSVIETTAELGSKVIVAICNQPDDARFSDLFGRYCEMAGKYGIRIALEFMRYSNVRTIKRAEHIVKTWGQSSTGLLIDALHLDRSGGTVAAVAKVDPERIVFFQLCDAKKLKASPSMEELRSEARTRRLAPGDGELPLFDLLDTLPDSVEIEYEVPRPEQAHLPLEERARIAAERFRTYMADYVRTRRSGSGWN
jgi:sugar phosphate isomerase/epimerase